MVSGCMMRKIKKPVMIEAENSPKESGDFMQLRSRRLDKSAAVTIKKRGSRNSWNSSSKGKLKAEKDGEKLEQTVKVDESVYVNEIEGVGVAVAVAPISDGIEAEKVGDNLLQNDRAIRESTPEHLIIRSDCIIAAGSSTRTPRDNVAARGPRRRLQGGCVPSVKDIESVFDASERQLEQHFMEKYNFNFKNESPLPGRYEWVKVEP